MRLSEWKRFQSDLWFQWLRAALTYTDMLCRQTVETKSCCFLRRCIPVCRVLTC